MICIILIVFVILAIVICTIGYRRNSIFRKDITTYLSNRYSEEMNIEEVNWYIDSGYIGYACPKNNTNLKFEVFYSTKENGYVDTYLEECLKTELENGIKNQIIDNDLYDFRVVLDNFDPTFRNKLEKKYQELKKPPTWYELQSLPSAASIDFYYPESSKENLDIEILKVVKQIKTLHYHIGRLNFLLENKGHDSLIYEIKQEKISDINTISDLKPCKAARKK